MATGSLSNGVCFDSAASAAANYFSTLPPFQYYDFFQGVPVSISYQPVSAVPPAWQQVTNSGGAITLAVAVPPPFPPCLTPLENYQNGLQVGAALGSVLLICFGFLAIKKILFP